MGPAPGLSATAVPSVRAQSQPVTSEAEAHRAKPKERSIQQQLSLYLYKCLVLRSNQTDKPHRVSSLNGLPFNT